ncbi:unnamed protein product [Owenia fusiformis]|uniref:Uncharacterized protein n=1 Tax=Owenia fusiformis TaxID=6347 RepID=A0A8J1TZR0_OWEFU|nr:unnamed protein product [Owenia fusiformis]
MGEVGRQTGTYLQTYVTETLPDEEDNKSLGNEEITVDAVQSTRSEKSVRFGDGTPDSEKTDRAELKISVPANRSLSTELVQATERGDTSAVKKVLRSTNVNPDLKWKPEQRSPLQMACGYGQHTVVEELLTAGADANQIDNGGRTPLHEACQGGHARCVSLLLEYVQDFDRQDRDGQSAVHIAAFQGELKCLVLLADRGAQLILEDSKGRQPSHLAAMRNHKKVLEFLFERGVDLECTDDLGKLPLHCAAQFGGIESVVSLLERDSDLTLGDNMGNLPGHYAAWHDRLDCLRFLVKQGTSLIATQGEGKTLAHVAALHGAVNVLHWLYEKSVDPNIKDMYGCTAGHYAAEAGKADCFNCYLQHDGSLDIENNKGDTPMASAKRGGHPLLMEKAIKNEAACPLCVKTYKRVEWERANQPPPVVREITSTSRVAYTSPLPKQQKPPTELQQSLARHGYNLKQVPKSKLPTRDLAARYFGDHIHDKLYKLNLD